jgi:hypothetical protein
MKTAAESPATTHPLTHIQRDDATAFTHAESTCRTPPFVTATPRDLSNYERKEKAGTLEPSVVARRNRRNEADGEGVPSSAINRIQAEPNNTRRAIRCVAAQDQLEAK